MDQDSKLVVGNIDPKNPTLLEWRAAFKCPHFSASVLPEPGAWLGIMYRGELLAVYGYTLYEDGTIMIDWLLCEPSRRGLAAAYAFGVGPLRELFQGKTVRFHTGAHNNKLLAPALKMGFKPVAYLMEAQF